MSEKLINWGDLVEFQERKEVEILRSYNGRENRKRFLDATSPSNSQVKQRISSGKCNSVLENMVLHDNLKLKVRETVTNIAKLKNDEKFCKLFDEEMEQKRSSFSAMASTPKRKMLGMPNTPPDIYETEKDVLERRQKQIDFGKNTLGYQNYVQTISKTEREKDHPITPKKYLKYSRRSWDALVKIWRKGLHTWDPKDFNQSYEEASDTSFCSNPPSANASMSSALDFDIEDNPSQEIFPQLMDD